MKVLCRHFRPVALGIALVGAPSMAGAASCDDAATFAKQHSLPAQACKVIDNGSIKQRVCAGETTNSLRIEIPGQDVPPIDATHVLTWYNDVPRSHPSGGQFNLGGTVFIGPKSVLSIRYRDFVRGDTAVSGGAKIPDDDVEVRTGETGSLTCAAVRSTSDADIDNLVASIHSAKR